MMRGFMLVLALLAMMGFSVWAYQQNYKTHAVMAEVSDLHDRIGVAHARLRMLRAEWAYLNRPDRLRDLANLNYDRLGLLPLMPEAFARVDQVIYPMPALLPITEQIEISHDVVTEEEPL